MGCDRKTVAALIAVLILDLSLRQVSDSRYLTCEGIFKKTFFNSLFKIACTITCDIGKLF